MKIRAIFILIIVCQIFITYGQTDTTLKKILALNCPSYAGKVVDSLVMKLPTNYTDMEVLSGGTGGYGDQLFLYYPNGVQVLIRVKKFLHMNPVLDYKKTPLNLKQQWSTTLFRKENIWYTLVRQYGNCWTGCEHDPKSTAP